MKFSIDYYRNLSLPIKASIWFTICNFLLKGIAFFTGPLFTRVMSPSEYGIFSVFISYEHIIMILATWEIYIGSYQKGLFKYKEDVPLFTTSTIGLTNFLSIVFFVLVLVFNTFIIPFTGISARLYLLLFVYSLCWPAYNCWLTRKRKAYSYKDSVTATLLFSVLNIIVPLIAMLLIERSANIRFASALIISSLFCFYFYIRSPWEFNVRKNWNRMCEFWKYSIRFQGPLVLHALSFLVLSQADRIMIGKMVGDKEVAFYSVAYSIACVVTIFQTSLNRSLQPWRYQMLEEEKFDELRQMTHKLLTLFAIIVLTFVLFIPELMRLLFPESYYEAVSCIPPISVGVFFMFMYSLFVDVEGYYEKTKYIVYVSFTCGVVNIILNYYLIDVFGYIACAYTTMVSYMLFALGHYIFMKKTLSNEGITEKVANGKVVMLISIIIVTVSILLTILYDYFFMRYLLLFVIILGFILEKNKLKVIINSIKKNHN